MAPKPTSRPCRSSQTLTIPGSSSGGSYCVMRNCPCHACSGFGEKRMLQATTPGRACAIFAQRPGELSFFDM
jgi:hypothetical protein